MNEQKKITSHAKDKIEKYYEKAPFIVKENGIVKKYFDFCRQQRYSNLFSTYLEDFGIDIRILSECKVPYFFYERWNFREAYLLCLYSNKFKIEKVKETTEIYNQLTIVAKTIREKWSEQSMTAFLHWLNQKVDYKPPNRTLLYFQILDTLFNYETLKKDITGDVLKKRSWIKNSKFLNIDYNLRVDEEIRKLFLYRDHATKICSRSFPLYESVLDILGTVKESNIKKIVKQMETSKKGNKRLFNIDTMELVTFAAAKSMYYNEDYCICGKNEALYGAYLKRLRETVNINRYRICENIEQIRSNIIANKKRLNSDKYYVEGMSFINLDTFQKNKTPNKNFVSNEYLILSDVHEKFEFFVEECQKRGLPSLAKKEPSITTTIMNSISTYVMGDKNNAPGKENKDKKEKKDKPRRPGIPKPVRDEVWRNAFDSLDGYCYCCLTAIRIENWDCGHIVAHARGGKDEADNLRPLCRTCNISMGKHNMIEWMKKYNMKGLSNFK